MMVAVNEAPAPDVLPRATPKALIAVIVVVMTPMLFIVGYGVQLLNPGFGVWFTEVFIFFGLSFIILRMSGRDPVRYPGLSPFRPGLALYGFALGVVNFFGIAIPILFVAQQLFPEPWVRAFESARVFRDRTPPELVLIVSGAILAAAVGEEYFFRGVLQRALSEARVRTRWAILSTSIVFSAIHGDPVGFMARLELGVLFGWLYWRTGSLWPGVFAHAANNATTTALFFLEGGQAAKGDTPPPTEAALAVALYGAVGITAFAALLRAPARWPALFSKWDLEERPLPRVGFYRLAWPWLAAAAASLTLLFALDRRGVALRWAEALHPVPKTLDENAPERRELQELRRRARSGEVPVAEYRARLEEISERHDGKPPPPPPPSIRPEPPSGNY